jgi:thioredoxin 1
MIRNRILILVVCAVVASGAAFSQTTKGTSLKKTSELAKGPVTFVELGSVNCIPCRQMQPVMKAIEKKYGDQVKVVFYDVWKPEQRKYAEQYGIKLIPTQVFLDASGKEFFRHEGFYPEAEIDKLLQKQGLKIQTGS